MAETVRSPLAVDNRAIRDVGQMVLPRPTMFDFWPCTRCGRQFPVSDSHTVTFDSGGRRLQIVVCPDCAARYRVPGPVRVALDRLPPAEQTAARDIRATVAHIRYVATARRDPSADRLRLRAADVRRLAADHGKTPSLLIERLRDLGLLDPT